MLSRASTTPRLLLAAATVLITWIVGCSSAGISAGRAHHSRSPEVRFYVSSADLPMLKGVEVYLVTASGESLMGKTDALGSLAISRNLLQREDSLAVLFCAEYFFCGAYRVRAPEFLEYDEHYIELAPLAVL